MTSVAQQTEVRPGNPFNLSDSEAYENWKQAKLAGYPVNVERLIVNIKDPYKLQASEKQAITDLCKKCGMAIYQLDDVSQAEKSLVHELGGQFGLSQLDSNLRADKDSVTSLQLRAQSGNQYIPYTDKPLSWHTDGYYNTLDRQIRGVILHCVSPAAEGGENGLMDHEMMYIRLRDENPAWIETLMHPETMTIPPNIDGGEEIRGAQTGPVFSVDGQTGSLHMRYSARKRNIEWRDDALTQQAADKITEILDDETFVFRHQLQAGQGIISNNTLHNRKGFKDGAGNERLMYRARYFDRVANTGLDAVNVES